VIRAATLFILIGLSIWLAVWFADNPGRVEIEIAGLRIGTRTGVLVGAILVFAVLSAAAYRLWRFARRAPGQLVRLRHANRRRKGYKALTQGMVAVAAGDSSEAIRFARKANVLLNDPPLTMLLSAQAAQLDGDEDAARHYFEAMLEAPDMAFLGVRGLLMQAIRRDDTREALRLANQADVLRPGTPWVLSKLFELQAGAQQWEAANKTLLQGSGAKNAQTGRRRRAVVALALSEEAAASGDHKQAIKQARAACELDSHLIPALAAHVRHLAAAGQMRKAAKTLLAAWARNPHPDLAAAFGALGGPDEAPLDRVKRFQSLYKARPDDIESRLTLAEASLAASLWGEARRYLEGIDQPSARHCRLMAALEEQESGDTEAARRWRDKAALAPPQSVWICGECGSGASAWTPTCDQCNAFDGLTWRVPPGILPQALAKVPVSS
jgi:HemY protein